MFDSSFGRQMIRWKTMALESFVAVNILDDLFRHFWKSKLLWHYVIDLQRMFHTLNMRCCLRWCFFVSFFFSWLILWLDVPAIDADDNVEDSSVVVFASWLTSADFTWTISTIVLLLLSGISLNSKSVMPSTVAIK